MSHLKNAHTSQTLPVHRSRDFVVTNGVAEGDPISFADELLMDDIYQITETAQRLPLSVAMDPDTGALTVAMQSAIGTAGNAIYLDCCLTFMMSDSTTCEVIVLVEVEDGGVEEVYILPLAPMPARKDFRLVGVDRDAALSRFAEMACVSFARGTHITLASGEQRKIEDLRVGDRVLTRDDGAQSVRWIGQTTLRAVGEFAPVVIRKGTLHNENDLILSPDHRVFIYQREDHLGAGRAEVLVRVRHLINGDTVYQQDGGYVDYFQVLFDEHQIIYAEGIAAESLLIDPRTRSAIPATVDAQRHTYRHHHDFEVTETLLPSQNAAEVLRKASSS